MKLMNLFGSRVVKTGVAVFLTALICHWFNWPSVFAVITAIVTLEPTISDSIKKGIIRFPASVIGSGYAVGFMFLFGNSPLAYTLAAVLTIATCFKLNLHAGLLVATLTSVTMVGFIESNYLIAFFTRLGTTTIGLVVSTGVNMFVLPPDYSRDVVENIRTICHQTGILLQKTLIHMIDSKAHKKDYLDAEIAQLHQKLEQTEILIRFQNDESKYHPLIGKEKRQFLQAETQLSSLRLLHYHLDNLNRMPARKVLWSEKEQDLIILAVREVGDSLIQETSFNPTKHRHRLGQLKDIFWGENEEIIEDDDLHLTAFPRELIILYELVAIYNVVDRLYREGNNETTTKAEVRKRLS